MNQQENQMDPHEYYCQQNESVMNDTDMFGEDSGPKK